MQHPDREKALEAERREDLKRWAEYQETGEHLSDEEMKAFLDELEG